MANSAIEVGIIEREGMTSVSVVLNSAAKAPHETHAQIAGKGQRVPVAHLLEPIETSWSLQRALLRYADTND